MSLIMKRYVKAMYMMKENTPVNKLADCGYFFALKVGLAGNASNSQKNLFTFSIIFIK